MESVAAQKRGLPEAASNGYGSIKKSKQEVESLSSGIGSKSKPCTKFFSTTGCQFGEGCHFLHYVPGGIKAVAQMAGGNRPSLTPSFAPPSFSDRSSPPAVKTRLCNKYNTAEGCRFGDKCHFAHGEWELGRPMNPTLLHDGPVPHAPGRFGRFEPPIPPAQSAVAASFGASATAKISVDASLAGPIIGKGGVNSKQICRLTGAKLSIRDHESDANMKNIELEGTFDQIKQASDMVRELIANLRSAGTPAGPPSYKGHHHQTQAGAGSNFKTKLCENFAKGSCTFGERCHFAHGAEELRSSGI